MLDEPSIQCSGTDRQKGGNDKYDLERAEREAKEKLMVKRKLQAVEPKTDAPADSKLDKIEDDSQESSEEAKDGEVEEIVTAPLLSEPTAFQPSNGEGGKGQAKENKKQKANKSERHGKRKGEQQDQEGQKPKRRRSNKKKKKRQKA